MAYSLGNGFYGEGNIFSGSAYNIGTSNTGIQGLLNVSGLEGKPSTSYGSYSSHQSVVSFRESDDSLTGTIGDPYSDGSKSAFVGYSIYTAGAVPSYVDDNARFHILTSGSTINNPQYSCYINSGTSSETLVVANETPFGINLLGSPNWRFIARDNAAALAADSNTTYSGSIFGASCINSQTVYHVVAAGKLDSNLPYKISFNAVTDVFICNNHLFSNGQEIQIKNISDFNPSIFYYVINSTANTFQVSLTRGGTVATGSTNGEGVVIVNSNSYELPEHFAFSIFRNGATRYVSMFGVQAINSATVNYHYPRTDFNIIPSNTGEDLVTEWWWNRNLSNNYSIKVGKVPGFYLLNPNHPDFDLYSIGSIIKVVPQAGTVLETRDTAIVVGELPTDYSNPASPVFGVTATISNTGNLFTVTSTSNRNTLHDGRRVQLNTTLPTGLSLATDYYVIDWDGVTKTFKLSATKGGAAITPSSNVTGTGLTAKAPLIAMLCY